MHIHTHSCKQTWFIKSILIENLKFLLIMSYSYIRYKKGVFFFIIVFISLLWQANWLRQLKDRLIFASQFGDTDHGVDGNESRNMGHLGMLYALSGNPFGFSYSAGDPNQWDGVIHIHLSPSFSVKHLLRHTQGVSVQILNTVKLIIKIN